MLIFSGIQCNKFFPVDKLHLYILKKGKNASLKKKWITYIPINTPHKQSFRIMIG